MTEYALSLSGFLVGVIVGLTGVGGGALMTPILLLVFAVAPQTAVGTDLLFAAITKSVAVVGHSFKNTIDWLVMRRLLYGSIPASLLMLLVLRFDWIGRLEDDLIVIVLASALVVTGIAQLARAVLHRIGAQKRTNKPSQFRSAQPALTIIAGAVIGALVTLTSIGAGALGAAVLTYLYPYRLTPVRLVATDIAHAIPLALVAGMGHLTLGNVDFNLLGLLLMGSIPGIVIGSWMATRASDGLLRSLIGVVLVLVGVRLVF